MLARTEKPAPAAAPAPPPPSGLRHSSAAGAERIRVSMSAHSGQQHQPADGWQQYTCSHRSAAAAQRLATAVQAHNCRDGQHWRRRRRQTAGIAGTHTADPAQLVACPLPGPTAQLEAGSVWPTPDPRVPAAGRGEEGGGCTCARPLQLPGPFFPSCLLAALEAAAGRPFLLGRGLTMRDTFDRSGSSSVSACLYSSSILIGMSSSCCLTCRAGGAPPVCVFQRGG